MNSSPARWAKYAFLFFLIIVLGIVGNFTFQTHRFNSKESYLKFEKSPQVWAHRGRHDKFPENSIAAFRHAFDSGATGIELDVHFDIRMNRFIVAHDYDYQGMDRDLLVLDSVFKQFGKSGFYWIDFKKLSKEKLKPSIIRMSDLLKTYDLQNNVFVESPAGELIGKFSQAGIQAIYWMKVREKKMSLKYLVQLQRFHNVVANYQFVGISAAYQYAEHVGFDNFGQFPVFLFTVNDPQKMAYYKSIPNVRVILTDNPSLY